MNNFLRLLFFSLIVRPLVFIIIGLNVRHHERLPDKGPAIIVANHNSHLDTLVLISLFPLKILPRIRVAAAADYFLKNKALAWFSKNIIGIIPVERQSSGNMTKNPLSGCQEALASEKILILFPEGSRGEPEKIAPLKKGIYHLTKDNPGVPIVPVILKGLGQALPKGEAILVPFFCDVVIGEAIYGDGDKEIFMQELTERFKSLEKECPARNWIE